MLPTTRHRVALLKLLERGKQDFEAGRVKPVAEVVARLRGKHRPRLDGEKPKAP
jgi:hypothetical protein